MLVDANSTTSSPRIRSNRFSLAPHPTSRAQRRPRIDSPITSTEGPLSTRSRLGRPGAQSRRVSLATQVDTLPTVESDIGLFSS